MSTIVGWLLPALHIFLEGKVLKCSQLVRFGSSFHFSPSQKIQKGPLLPLLEIPEFCVSSNCRPAFFLSPPVGAVTTGHTFCCCLFEKVAHIAHIAQAKWLHRSAGAPLLAVGHVQQPFCETSQAIHLHNPLNITIALKIHICIQY